jgi:adenosylcobyric acid synthase
MLAVETIFAAEKITALVTAADASGNEVSGYEIHNGRVIRLNHRAAFRIRERDGRSVDEPEGMLSDDGRILGTSIHGLLDGPVFRRHYLNQIRDRRGLAPLGIFGHNDAKGARMRAYNRFADLLANNLDISSLAALVGLNRLMSSSGYFS